MKPLVILAPAGQDLRDIWAFIAQDNVKAADQLLDRLYEVFELMQERPKLGRARDDLGRGVRSFASGAYVVFYREGGNSLDIVRVLHGRRDLDQIDF